MWYFVAVSNTLDLVVDSDVNVPRPEQAPHLILTGWIGKERPGTDSLSRSTFVSKDLRVYTLCAVNRKTSRQRGKWERTDPRTAALAH